MKENIRCKDVRIHHRICDAEKRPVNQQGNLIGVQELRNIKLIGVGGRQNLQK